MLSSTSKAVSIQRINVVTVIIVCLGKREHDLPRSPSLSGTALKLLHMSTHISAMTSSLPYILRTKSREMSPCTAYFSMQTNWHTCSLSGVVGRIKNRYAESAINSMKITIILQKIIYNV